MVETFSLVSGLKLNIDKTEGLLIGSLKDVRPTYHGIKWTTDPIRYLGVYICNNPTMSMAMNWTSKLKEMQKLVDSWRTRKLTLYGKVTIIKTLVLPKRKR